MRGKKKEKRKKRKKERKKMLQPWTLYFENFGCFTQGY